MDQEELKRKIAEFDTHWIPGTEDFRGGRRFDQLRAELAQSAAENLALFTDVVLEYVSEHQLSRAHQTRLLLAICYP